MQPKPTIEDSNAEVGRQEEELLNQMNLPRRIKQEVLRRVKLEEALKGVKASRGLKVKRTRKAKSKVVVPPAQNVFYDEGGPMTEEMWNYLLQKQADKESHKQLVDELYGPSSEELMGNTGDAA